MKFPTSLIALCIACGGATVEPQPEPEPIITPIVTDSCTVGRPNFGPPATQAELSLFSYDANAPLNLQKTVEKTANGVEVSSIIFDSPAGGQVTGRLFIPLNRPGPRPGIVLMHGMPGTALSVSSYAQTLAQFGAVVIAIDAPFNRRGGSPIRFIKADRDEQIQLMKDLQRAVDVLRAQPTVAHDRIAYVGISYGGAMGALFAGIERRLKTAVLVVGDGGLVTHMTGKEDYAFLSGIPCSVRLAWFREMVPIEPIRFIGLATPTPLLLQSGRTDNLVPPGDATLLHDAAPEPKSVRWYDAGHSLDQQAFFDRVDWLREKIGIELTTVPGT